ncbi:biliverdin-producing heme oxygenase [Microbispora sp. NBRC 16548]|uniref:biliverdin-producing heme oxygenase n=1 Tax=Microbispora sp. NBRC 16548 TaxID=3030994 RepID=UPI0024A563EC|nr:biliverdin-producing heme oxygenase [Microbispora sp. NBRC 16548]GLX06806.1 hypothetical protein Misp03_37330 [Microbispora sp. NBRC 16548]
MPVSTAESRLVNAPPAVRQMWLAVADAHTDATRHMERLHAVKDADDYCQTLAAYFGWQDSAETLLLRFDWSPTQWDPRTLTRLDGLHQDLLDLGVSSAQQAALPRCRLPEINTLAEAVGLAMVLLGSTLGAQKMHRWVRDRLPEAPVRFFATPVRTSWRDFGAMTERALPTAQQRAAAASAAARTMHAFVSWAETWASGNVQSPIREEVKQVA